MQIAEIADVKNFPLCIDEINILTWLIEVAVDSCPCTICNGLVSSNGIYINSGTSTKGIHHIHMLTGMTYLYLLERRGLISINYDRKSTISINRNKFKYFPQLNSLRMQIALGTIGNGYNSGNI